MSSLAVSVTLRNGRILSLHLNCWKHKNLNKAKTSGNHDNAKFKKILEQIQASMNCDIIENKGNTCYINALLQEELARTLSMLKSRKAALDPSHVSQSL